MLFIHQDVKATSNRRLLLAIEDAKMEMESAISTFNTCADPRLIEMAIYQEKIAKIKLDYLINEAKKDGIKISYKDILYKKEPSDD